MNGKLSKSFHFQSRGSTTGDWDLGPHSQMTRSITIFCGTGVFFLILLLLNECNFWRWINYTVSFRTVGTTNDAAMDVDVIKERDFVTTMGESNVALLNLVCNKLCKAYDIILAVNDLSFTIEGCVGEGLFYMIFVRYNLPSFPVPNALDCWDSMGRERPPCLRY